MSRAKRHPIQPIVRDRYCVKRFKENKIVVFLLDSGPFDMDALAAMNFSKEDRQQFAQLIGYSVSGYGDLSYVTRHAYKRANGESKS